MRWRPFTWILLSLACFLGAFYFWRFGNEIKAERLAAATASTSRAPEHADRALHRSQPASTAPAINLSRPQSSNGAKPRAAANERFKYRLSNTSRTLGELAQNDQAILLENALIDSGRPLDFTIPDKLRAQGDPGTYIVQARGLIDNAFRAALKESGGEIIAYVPNNAYLVRASASAARQLSSNPQTQSVYPYEPYYKISAPLLARVMADQSVRGPLNVLIFADAFEATKGALGELGAIVGESPSPFGRVITLDSADVVAAAALPGVQRVEPAPARAYANDISRARMGVAINTVTQATYLNLSGSNVIVQVNDTGVSTNHPDLEGRVFSDYQIALYDTNGHGTHVAGIIAGNGSKSTTVSNAIGSIRPPGTNKYAPSQFRGMATNAFLYSLPFYLPDFVLQESAARTNALISNNSWTYNNDSSYDIAAASYDAAVRDSLPGETGSQQVLYVFAAGGLGNDPNHIGNGGNADTILSPATAKNVITVGAVENSRNITNEVHVVDFGFTNTSTPWLIMTDSSNQVSGFSSRGNVGVGSEGDFGRFKPDLVAPGTMIVSTRSPEWDTNAYYNPTNYDMISFPGVTLETNLLFGNQIPTSFDTVQVLIDVFNLFPNVGLPVFVRHDTFPNFTTYDFVRTNHVSMPPDAALTGQDDLWYYGVGNQTTQAVTFDLQVTLVNTNDFGDYFDILRTNLNQQMDPYYRYESGTSMAAANVSGVLALLQDFFTNRLSLRPSPALLKAMLINGARSLPASGYNFQVENNINFQGWGFLNLTNSLPKTVWTNGLNTASAPMYVFDQERTNALATGQSITRFFSLSPVARTQPLRISLVWSDPPGNPAVGIKLVNDLDLVVTNLQNTNVFFGNDILANNFVNLPWKTNEVPNRDLINNVENVYLSAPLASSYSVTVRAKRVNVNAVTAHTNDVVQDYALVVSSANGQFADALTLTNGSVITNARLNLTVMTNDFGTNNGISGQLLLEQRVAANPALLGTNTVPLGTNTIWGANGRITAGLSNQWNFYILTNDTAFTNVIFATFLTPNLAPTQMGVTNTSDPREATRTAADIDLYVTTNPDLLLLNPAAIQGADKSLKRNGSESIVYTNSVPGRVYYIGVKSEDQQAAEFALLGLVSELPPNETDDDGNVFVRFYPLPSAIPDARLTGAGTIDPGRALMVGVGYTPVTIRRLIVTNQVSHELMGDLVGILEHEERTVVLNNHSCILSNGVCNTNAAFVYDDSGETPIAGARHSDGPGSLRDFVGEDGTGNWIFTMVDSAVTHVGSVTNFGLLVQPLKVGDGTNIITIGANSWGYLAVDVPPEATNLTVLVFSNTLPLELYLRRGDFPTRTEYDHFTMITPPGGQLSVNAFTVPPLLPGRYFIGIFNPNAVSQTVYVVILLDLSLDPIQTVNFASGGTVPLNDDAVNYSRITIANISDNVEIARADVGVAISHPRVSDLVLTLISPRGERILLMENRGGPGARDLGSIATSTNLLGFTHAGQGSNAIANSYGPIPTNGILLVDYSYVVEPDSIDVYYDNINIFSRSNVSGSGRFVIPYGPGISNQIWIVMNQNGNPSDTTVWTNTVSVISQTFSYFTFTDNTNLATVPVKFAIPPFAGAPVLNSIGDVTLAGPILNQENGHFYHLLTNANWTTSEAWSIALGGHLATINDAVENAWVTDAFLTFGGVTNDLWIGLNAAANPGNYVWADGDQSGYRNWEPPGPSTGFPTEDYVHIFGGSTPPHVPGWTPGLWNNFINIGSYTLGDGSGSLRFILGVAEVIGFYYFPEEPLRALEGSSPNGTWTIEVRDARAGAAGGTPPPAIVSWELQFTLATNTAGVQNLPDGVPVTNTITGCGFAYFTVDVPPEAHYATNILLFASSPVNVWYSANGLPSTNDFLIITNATSGRYMLSYTNGPPQLFPGTRYYLGVENTNCATNVTFAVQVDFGVDIITLLNMVPYAGSNSASANLTNDYYHFFIPTNAARAQFEINNPSGNVALALRKGLPLPNLNNFDYLSDNPGTNDELIVLFTNSVPVALTPGNWYVTAVNLSAVPVNYTIIASWWPTTGLPIDIIDAFLSGTNSFCITWRSLPGVHYYVQGVTNLSDRNWRTVSPEIVATDTNTTFCIGLPSVFHFFRVVEGLVLDSFLPPVVVGDGTTATNVIPACQFLNYSVDVPASALLATNTIVFASAPVNVWFNQTAFPTGTNAGDILLIANATSGSTFTLSTTGAPPLIPGGQYFLSIENPCANTTNVTVALRVDFWPPTITLTEAFLSTTNSFCITWNSSAGYHYYVEGVTNLSSTNWTAVSSDIFAIGTSTTWCISLPSPYTFFRVRTGLAPSAGPVVTVTQTGGNYLLQWSGLTTSLYQVEWKPTLSSPTWTTVPGFIGSATGQFSFLDDGSQTGGLGPTRFYRVLLFP